MIVVLVPELETLLAEAEQLPPLFRRFLARSRPHRIDPMFAESLLVTGQPLAAAPLSRLADHPLDADGIWLRADPVRLQPDLNAVWLQAEAGLSEAAIRDLVACFADEGLTLDFPTPSRGYLRLESIPECSFHPPWSLAGNSLDHVLPHGPDAGRWRRLLNDSQIILHQHTPEATGNTAGSLWFWGAGALPAASKPASRVSHLVGDSPVLVGISRFLSLSHEPVVHRRGAADGSLVLWPGRTERSASENLVELAGWLQPLWQRLGRFGLDSLELASRERCLVLKPRDRWRIWQRQASALP
ncbi:MAG: hypothetical protein EA370_00755 [Wenzhouxiangella sp.]|nr:MAG: hypothetical protein EA370_00755 [Wenzhouxiangella sp.]